MNKYRPISVPLHSAAIAIQEGFQGEELGHPCLFITPVEHRRCVLTDVLEGPWGAHYARSQRVLIFIAYDVILT